MHMCKKLITWDNIHNLRRMETLQRRIIKSAVYKHLQHIQKTRKILIILLKWKTALQLIPDLEINFIGMEILQSI